MSATPPPDPIDPEHYWVICIGNGIPALTNGRDIETIGEGFSPNDYSCPNTSSSPIWIRSGEPIYKTNSQFHGSAHQPGSRASAPSPMAYLGALLLDLPFPARRAGSENTSLNCDPTQPDLLQVNHFNASVNRISTCPAKLVATIKVATRPLQIAIAPDGSMALVTSFDNAVNFIDLSTNKVTFTLPTGLINPNGIAISPDGTTAYITDFSPGGMIAKIDLASRQIVATLQVEVFPQNIFITPDGEQIYVTFPYGNLVRIFDTLTFSAAFSLQVPGPRGIAFNSKGTKAYIASAGNPSPAVVGNVLELNTNTLQVANTYKVGLGPNDVAVLYSDQFVVTTNYEGKSISKIDTITGAVQTTPVSDTVSGLSIVY